MGKGRIITLILETDLKPEQWPGKITEADTLEAGTENLVLVAGFNYNIDLLSPTFHW